MVFLVLAGSIGIASTTFQYVVLLCLGLCFLTLIEKFRIVPMVPLDFIPFLMFSCWMYGVTVALIKGVEIENIFRNFFGIVIYLYYYAFIFYKVSNQYLYKAVVLAGICNIIYALFYFCVWITSDLAVNLSADYSYSSRFRSYYSAGIMVIFPILSCLVFEKLSGSSNYNKAMAGVYDGFWLMFIISSFAIVFTTFSKGFILAYVLFFLVMVMIFIFRSFFVSKKYLSSWFSLFFAAIFVGFVFMYTEVGEQVEYMYSSKELSNNMRSIQRQYLIDEYSFDGAGLGARLESGYERDSRGYGFETTYENIIHKFGVVSIFIFMSLLIPLFISIKNMINYKNTFYSSISFGLMLYLIPSIGNPMLFSPMFVLMHILSIKFLRETKRQNDNLFYNGNK